MPIGTREWTTAGGDFVETASATAQVGPLGTYTISSPGMVADIEAWSAAPDSNFGWLIRGNEEGKSTAKRFDSKDNPEESVRPVLEIEYVEQ